MDKQEYLDSVAQQVLYDCAYMRIPYGDIVEFTVNTRAKTRWGQCSKRPDGYHININEVLCDGKHEEGLRNTLFHEVLHTCPKCLNHGERWKHWAAIIREHTGVEVKRTSDCAEKGFDTQVLRRREPKYQLKCKQCGNTVNYASKGQVVKYYKYYRCGRCNGDLELEILR